MLTIILLGNYYKIEDSETDGKKVYNRKARVRKIKEESDSEGNSIRINSWKTDNILGQEIARLMKGKLLIKFIHF